jgi:hypothetical protein
LHAFSDSLLSLRSVRVKAVSFMIARVEACSARFDLNIPRFVARALPLPYRRDILPLATSFPGLFDSQNRRHCSMPQ